MTSQNNKVVHLDTEWFKVLYDYGAVGNFRREINDLLETTDPRTSPDWLQICEWGRELLPEEPIFNEPTARNEESKSLSLDSDELDEALIDSEVFKKLSGQTKKERECELAKFRDLCGDYFGRKVMQAKVYAELDDIERAAALLVEVLRKGPKHYQILVMELLEELDSDVVIEAMTTNTESSSTGQHVRNTPKSIGILGDMSERFERLTEDETSRRLVLTQIYMELGDLKRARSQIRECMRENEHKTNPLVNDLAKDLSMLGDDNQPVQVESNVEPDSCTESGMNDLLNELSGCLNRVGRDDHAKKLALAYFYIKLGDYEMARKLIIDVLDEGEEKHRLQARRLNQKLKEAAG